MFGQMLNCGFIWTFVIAGVRYTAKSKEWFKLFHYCYNQKVQFLMIYFALYGILYLRILTIKNIQKFSSIISTSKSGTEIINISVNCFRCIVKW